MGISHDIFANVDKAAGSDATTRRRALCSRIHQESLTAIDFASTATIPVLATVNAIVVMEPDKFCPLRCPVLPVKAMRGYALRKASLATASDNYWQARMPARIAAATAPIQWSMTDATAKSSSSLSCGHMTAPGNFVFANLT